MISRQQERKEDGKYMVFDLKKETKFYCMDFYDTLLYFIGIQPWVFSSYTLVEGFGKIAFEDEDWYHLSHAVIVKNKNLYKQEIKDEIINLLAPQVPPAQCRKLIELSLKRLSTKCEKNCNFHTIFNELVNLEKIIKDGDEKITIEVVVKFLQIWSEDVISGPLAITRSLGIENIDNHSSSIFDPITKQIKSKLKHDNWKHFDIKNVTLLDDRYYLISGEEEEDMEFPWEIQCEFIGVSDGAQQIENKDKGICKKRIKEEYITRFGTTKNFAVGVWIMEEQEGDDQYYMKFKHGSDVFDGINGLLNKIFNSIRFNVWIKSQDIELWYGQDEQTKLEDHRNLKKEAEKLKEEVFELKSQLREYQNDEE